MARKKMKYLYNHYTFNIGALYIVSNIRLAVLYYVGSKIVFFIKSKLLSKNFVHNIGKETAEYREGVREKERDKDEKRMKKRT